MADDLAGFGLSAAGTVLQTVNGAAKSAGAPYYPTGAAISTPRLPQATRTATGSASVSLSMWEIGVGLAVLFAGYKVARAL